MSNIERRLQNFQINIMSFELNKTSDCTMKYTASEAEKLIREQRKARDIFRNIDTSPCTSGNTREQQAVLYLKENKIHAIIEFMTGNLLLRRPYNPYEYLTQLLDKYVLFRSGLVESPFPYPFKND